MAKPGAVQRFTSVAFRNYKALRQYSVSLQNFNVLVGPNNSGKSTIVGAFRILSEGIRKAASRNPEYLVLPDEQTWGYRVPLEDLPVSTENVFSDYDDSQPARIEFRVSGGNRLQLVFPEPGVCCMVCRTTGRPVRSASDFRREFQVNIGFVPVLGPVEHDEPLYQAEAARRALLTHRAARNFRNIWYHYSAEFEEFRELIRTTWPGMDIEAPVVDTSSGKPLLKMFCPEERYPREIYWAGFGFQVWCQLLTFIVRSRSVSLLVIDEPDIYLHSDLQRQLVTILKTAPSDVVLATHSTEIISEAEAGDLVLINKKAQSAKRIKDPVQLQSVFNSLGSNLNPTLTQLAKTRRAVFVEGKDFQLLGAFARKRGKSVVANRSQFAVVPVDGYNPQKVSELAKGMELTLGGPVLKAAVFDRDYRSDEEVEGTRKELARFARVVHIHDRKELENYVLDPVVMQRALSRQITEHNRRSGSSITFGEDVQKILITLSESMKHMVSAQFLAKRSIYQRSKTPAQDPATVTQRLLEEFDVVWNAWDTRCKIVPGKELLSSFNSYVQDTYKVTVTALTIVDAMLPHEVPLEIATLIDNLDGFGEESPVSAG